MALVTLIVVVWSVNFQHTIRVKWWVYRPMITHRTVWSGSVNCVLCVTNYTVAYLWARSSGNWKRSFLAFTVDDERVALRYRCDVMQLPVFLFIYPAVTFLRFWRRLNLLIYLLIELNYARAMSVLHWFRCCTNRQQELILPTDRAFRCAGPSVWNSLNSCIVDSSSMAVLNLILRVSYSARHLLRVRPHDCYCQPAPLKSPDTLALYKPINQIIIIIIITTIIIIMNDVGCYAVVCPDCHRSWVTTTPRHLAMWFVDDSTSTTQSSTTYQLTLATSSTNCLSPTNGLAASHCCVTYYAITYYTVFIVDTDVINSRFSSEFMTAV